MGIKTEEFNLKHNSNQEPNKGALSFRFIPGFSNKKNRKHLKQTGMSFTELIVALGIATLLTGVGYMSYIYFFQVTAKLNAFHQIGAHVLQRMMICAEEAVLNTGQEKLIWYEDLDPAVDSDGDGNPANDKDKEKWKGCNTKSDLNLTDCEECKVPKISEDGRRICMTIKKDRLSQCVGYRPTGAAANRFKITVNRKVCVQARGLTGTACTADSDCDTTNGEKCLITSGSSPPAGVCEDPKGRSAVWPYVDCESDDDCSSTNTKCLEGQGKCEAFVDAGGNNSVKCF